ncbi:hypothetical protein C0Q70_05051 [Pomacea canaliculata]|uniref:Thioredoxin domain-containing protein 9 n=1 Tax=Pomacea canaliculata TaxID=400727 RepID=A0A2T7PK57_POMCA|nr:thioredoxin domain-containing protein plp1-like [Pomacea canaliculata]PVD33790.1 hypothetical protein C0Q70_05051 [Pomacea canaliculata]
MATSATADQAQAIIDDKSLVEEELWEELEKGDIPAHIRESRLEELKLQSEQFHNMKERDHGEYTLLQDEKKFLEQTTTEQKCVVHFFHSDFRRCAIVDSHLEKLAKKYFETKFSRINVEVAKFLVNKLKIQVLPAIICFNKGIVVDRIIGFEDFGNSDDFRTEVLERRLAESNTIKLPGDKDHRKTTVLGAQRHSKKDDSSSDDDE